MKVFYHSVIKHTELIPGEVLHVVPCKAFLEILDVDDDASYNLLYNRELLDPGIKRIECSGNAELIVKFSGYQQVYYVRPCVQPLSIKYAKAYEQFAYEYKNIKQNEIISIQNGELKLYAIDQSAEVQDWTDVFNQIRDALNSFKVICEKPKSHLKAVNEVRPIETVKRIGYESIPYLAAHSEDWLARTASGLKPARLFSRVEDDEFQIYENRVVKTLLDLVIRFLRKTEKQLRDQRDQLRGIINSAVQIGSFGFDKSFQKAVYELMSSDTKDNEYRSKSLDLVEELQRQAFDLLKRYRALRQTRLYRYLKKSKPVTNPLNETNILVLDKYYSVIFKLWKTIHRIVAPAIIEEKCESTFADTYDAYQKFCATLCGYAAHILEFEPDPKQKGRYFRFSDNIEMLINAFNTSDYNAIHVVLKDKEPRSVDVPQNIDIPITPGPPKRGSREFTYDGFSLSWPNDITNDEIDAFCSIFKKSRSYGKERIEESRKFKNLKSWIVDQQRKFDEPKQTGFLLIASPIELDEENRSAFKNEMEIVAQGILDKKSNEQVIVALPLCNESEQKITTYAKEDGQPVSLLPLTMFDINSFRRIQNVLYRHILMLKKEGKCPNCGGTMQKNENQFICNNCNQLTVTKTICPKPECRHEYLYMSYNVSQATLEGMRKVEPENFYQWDSLYQYKDIVNMTVSSGKIRTVCPRCHQD
jgi:hypothetical protein